MTNVEIEKINNKIWNEHVNYFETRGINILMMIYCIFQLFEIISSKEITRIYVSWNFS